MTRPIVSRSLDEMCGTVVVHGPREPAQALLDYLEAVDSINDFLDGLPAVTREPAVVFVENPIC